MKEFLKQKNKKNGFTLVETLVALTIFTMSVVALMSILSGGISNINYAKKKMAGAYLAQEGIEYVRNMRDSYLFFPDNDLSWYIFYNKFKQFDCSSGLGCGFNSNLSQTDPDSIFTCSSGSQDPCKLYVYNGKYNSFSSNHIGSDSGFTRTINVILAENDNKVRVFSRVSWMQGTRVSSITLSEDLFNWTE